MTTDVQSSPQLVISATGRRTLVTSSGVEVLEEPFDRRVLGLVLAYRGYGLPDDLPLGDLEDLPATVNLVRLERFPCPPWCQSCSQELPQLLEADRDGVNVTHTHRGPVPGRPHPLVQLIRVDRLGQEPRKGQSRIVLHTADGPVLTDMEGAIKAAGRILEAADHLGD